MSSAGRPRLSRTHATAAVRHSSTSPNVSTTVPGAVRRRLRLLLYGSGMAQAVTPAMTTVVGLSAPPMTPMEALFSCSIFSAYSTVSL